MALSVARDKAPIHYLAYGSNLHPLRLTLRVPSAQLVGIVRLDGYRLRFRKRGKDGSAKCDLDFTNDPSHAAYAAVYEMRVAEAGLLDEAEGLGSGYDKTYVDVSVGGEPCTAFVYRASQSHISGDLQPYRWYKELVLAGARKHAFPPDYLRWISSIPSRTDPERRRRLEMEDLLVRLES